MTSTNIDDHLDRVDWGRQQKNGEVLLSPSWEVFILGISILSVFNLFLVLIVGNPDIHMVFVIMDALLTGIFLMDVLRRMVVADSVRRYLIHGYGWVDLIAAFPILRILRLVRIVRVVLVMRRLGGPIHALKAFFSNRAAGGLLSVLLIAILVMEFGALGVLAAERGVEGANIETAEDALWYMLVTMSTVGYGDFYPVSSLGRAIGSLIIIVGVGVFGTLTGFLANVFLAPREAAQSAAPPAAESPAEGSDDAEAGEATATA
jgi:voltage-gated potassium channel